MAKKKRLSSGEGWSLEPASDTHAPPPQTLPPEKQTLTLKVEKRPKGKVVTVIGGMVAQPDDLQALCKTLKKKCGGGGSVKEGQIEIQGDHLDTVRAYLQQAGYSVKG